MSKINSATRSSPQAAGPFASPQTEAPWKSGCVRAQAVCLARTAARNCRWCWLQHKTAGGAGCSTAGTLIRPHPLSRFDANTLEMVKAGDHCSFRMSKQMLPLLLMFGWYTLVIKLTWHNDKRVNT